VLTATARGSGAAPDISDDLIAATAKMHGLEVLTFNMADFRPTGIACRDPLTNPPEVASD
jgi:predicted nucleic acid-binding protein